jgi:hypothetical protein
VNIAAMKFDKPVDSPEHSDRRNSAWIGGDLVEGRYLLGMLIGKNLFRMSNERYASELNKYLCTNVSALVGEVFGNIHACHHVIPYLRHKYRTRTEFPPMPTQDMREEGYQG